MSDEHHLDNNRYQRIRFSFPCLDINIFDPTTTTGEDRNPDEGRNPDEWTIMYAYVPVLKFEFMHLRLVDLQTTYLAMVVLNLGAVFLIIKQIKN